jgi:hypothetical protein
MRGKVHLAAAAFGAAVNEMPCLQKTGAEGIFQVQFTEEPVGFGRKEGWLYRAETG